MCEQDVRCWTEELEVKFLREVHDALDGDERYHDNLHLSITQIEPWTYSELSIKFDGKWRTAVAFAKANLWEDEFDKKFGVDLCIHRCVRSIVQGITSKGKDASDGVVYMNPIVSPELLEMSASSVSKRMSKHQRRTNGPSRQPSRSLQET